MVDVLTQKELYFNTPANQISVLNESVANFSTNLRSPMDISVEIAPNPDGRTEVEIFNANCEFNFPSRIVPKQEGEGEASARNRRPIRPGLSIVKPDGSILDIYDGTLTIHDDESWTVTRSTDNYHPTGNEPNYSKTGNQVIFTLPDIYNITGYNYYNCSDFNNTVAYNDYAYIRTGFSVSELQAYFREHTVDLILPLKQTESYTIQLPDVKRTLALFSSNKRSKSITVTIGTEENPVYGGRLKVYPDGSAELTVTHDLIEGELQELATQVERHLENVGTLWSYFGINNVWADSGKILSVRYRSQTPVNGMMWQRDRVLQLRRRAIIAAAFQSLT